MTTIQLTTWDRVIIANIIGALQGDVKLMRKADKIIDLIELTSEERGAVNFNYDERAQFATWEDQERKWDVTFNDPESLVFLKETLRGKSDWPALQRKQVLRLYAELGIE